MKFLITNDDGYDAPGLAALYSALRPLGDVRVVAPAVCHSAKGHAVNTHVPIRVVTRDVAPFGQIEVVEASPADCVRIGLCESGAERPDFVVAGINPGANLGVDLFYSGTAAAAREASILGVRALAVSRYVRPDAEICWETLSGHVTRVVKELTSTAHRLPTGRFWNVNFPAIPKDDHPEDITFTRQGLMAHDVSFQAVEKDDAQGIRLLEYTGQYQARGKSGDCDVSHNFSDRITATAVDLCTTADHPSMFGS